MLCILLFKKKKLMAGCAACIAAAVASGSVLDPCYPLRLLVVWGLFCGLLREQMFLKWVVFKVLHENFVLKAMLS